MMVRRASAEWEGGLPDGKGQLRLGSGAYTGAYSFASRFQEGAGTNPEELLGAAHAGCFAMALAYALTQAGHPPERIAATAGVHLEKVGEGYRITTIDLTAEGEVPGLEPDRFEAFAEDAKRNCPVSQLFTGAVITLKATLRETGVHEEA